MGPERDFIVSGYVERLWHVIIAARPLAGATKDILRLIRFAAADAVVIDRMRPHIVCRQQPSFLKGPPHVHLSRVKVAVAVVAAPLDHAELRIWLLAGQRVDRVDVRRRQDVRAFVAQIGSRADDTPWKASLHRCGPGGDIYVLAVAVHGTRRNDAGRALKKRIDRITQPWRRDRRQTARLDTVRDRPVLIVLLPVA